MKMVKLFFIVILLILTIPVVSASITLSPFSSDVYNFGDRILLYGSVSYPEDARANLNLFLNCDGKSVQVAAVLLNLKANEPNEFSNFLVLPMDLAGDCKFNANLIAGDGSLLETTELKAFKVTGELKGTFEMPKNQFQLGDAVYIKGTVTKQSNELIDGSAVIAFKKDNNPLFFDTLEVKRGLIDFSKTLSSIPPGDYSVDIFVTDNYGNKKPFSDIFNFSVDGNLEISSSLDKNVYSPGDTINLNGYIFSKLRNSLSNIRAEFDFTNEIKSRELSTSAETFSVSYVIPSRIKTGNHNITITASDDEGNYGIKYVEFNVRAVPTLMAVTMEQGSYDPEQNAGFVVTLLDQAGDQMQENINVELSGPDNKVISSKIVSTGSSVFLTIPKQASPGSWKITADGLGLNNAAIFNVREYKKLDADIKGTNIIVNNVGNVPYTGSFEFIGNGINKMKNLNLDVGKSTDIKLDKFFPPGSYNLTLPSMSKYFENVIIPEGASLFSGFNAITGNAVKNADSSPGRKWGLFVALIVLCSAVFYLMLSKRRTGKVNKMNFSKRDYELGRKKLDELRSKGIRKDSKPMEYGKATKEDIEDWKMRVQKSFNEQENRKSSDEFVRHQQRNMKEDKPGIFNMFG